MMTPDPIIEDAPAKLNLALHVVGQRGDGYHLLDSLVVFTAFGDSIECALAPEDRFTIEGPKAHGVPLDARNLSLKARDYLRAQFGAAQCPPIAIKLIKNLPAAAGIGGGSADAGATLRALMQLWQLDAHKLEDAAMADQIGADVPMCFLSQPLRAEGIGDHITPLAHGLPALPLVLVNCGEAMPTPAVFAGLNDRHNTPLPAIPALSDIASLCEYLALCRNDLESPAMTLSPAIGECLLALDQAGAQFSRMSGSGATCFGIFSSDEAAHMASQHILSAYPYWFCTATTSLRN